MAATAHGDLVVSRTARGRGAWLCQASAAACAARAYRRRAFARALRVEVRAGAEQALIQALNALDVHMNVEGP